MIEIRNHNDNINFRNDNENRHVEGYAVLFESPSNLINGSFIEVIERGALDGIIERSDVLCLLNHNEDKGVLARCNKGIGSMTLTIDERGLKYSFDAPKMALGDELIEGLKRGDISTSSFAFTVGEDSFEQRADGQVIRHIHNINQLFDVSPVYCAAYPETSVDLRSYDKFMEELNKQKETRSEEEKEVKESEEKEPQKEEKEVENDTKEEEPKEEIIENSEEEKQEESEEKQDEKRNLKENNLYNKTDIINNMNTKFSLIKTINDVVNNRNLDETAQSVIKEGRSAANIANVETNGQIVIALEKRAEGDTPATPATATPNGIMATEATLGKEAVPTETFDIVGALRDKMVLAQAGAQFMSLQGNVEIPIYSGANCTWESEIGEAKDGSGKFSSVKLSPKRLTATLPVSRQFLIQSSESAEALLRNDLINAIAEKLQKTILGNGVGDSVTPKGLFANCTADTAAFTYEDAVQMEAVLEGANVYGDYKYIVSPSAKAALRTISMDKGSGKFIYENNAILGVDADSTNSVVNKGVVLADWRELIIGAFGALDIVVDPYTAAAKGQVILTVNAFFDYVERRPEAFVKRILK